MAVTGDGCVYELRTTGSMNNGAGVVWLHLGAAIYKWTLSGSGTSEYYCEAAAGGDPGLAEAKSMYTDGEYNLAANGTLGSLVAGAWDWGDNDSLGYSTVYVRLADGADPDTKNYNQVGMVAGGGIDYSQQNSPALAITDLVIDAADNTKVSSALTPFVAPNHLRNILKQVSGTGFTVGWFEVKAIDGSGVATLDRAAGTVGSTGGVANLGGAGGVPTDAFFDADIGLWNAPGRRVFIQSGIYTFTESINIAASGSDGTDALPVWIIGYDTIRGDDPNGINRPFFAMGIYSFAVRLCYIIKNLSLKGASVSIVLSIPSRTNTIINGKEVQTSNSNYTAIGGGGSSYFNRLIGCEAVCWRGHAITIRNTTRLINCYAHDSDAGDTVNNHGLQLVTGAHQIYYSIFCGNQHGIYFAADSAETMVINCIVDDNQRGIYKQGSGDNSFYNNVISNNKIYGVQDTVLMQTVLFDNNLWFGNAINATLVNLGENEVYGDPKFVNPQGTLIDDCENAWTAGANVTATADAVIYKVGTASAKFAVVAGASTNQIIGYKALVSPMNMAAYPGAHCWVRTSVALSAGDWQIRLCSDAVGATPVITYALPAMSVDTWYKCWIDNDPTGFGAATAINSISIYQVTDKGAMNFWIDELRGGDRDFTIRASSPVVNAALRMNTDVGVKGNYHLNIGVDQGGKGGGAGAVAATW